MLYVFHVDVGRMMSFDMTVALSSVENLKDTIERLHGIPAANIVLLVSGGEMLAQSTQVSCYSAGTDTNPIYMFLTGEPRMPPPLQPNEPDRDLSEQVDRCKQLPPVYASVEKRAQLALKMYEYARDEERLCERLVHEQHLQQQGWSAVVANMEDLTNEFRQRFRNFCSAFDRHLEKRSTYLELLHNFNDDLTKLARIPILPGLMPLAEEDFHGFDEFLEPDDVFSRSHSTQESVLVAAGVPAQQMASGRHGEPSAAEEEGGISADDKNSTSPNKKLKMGTDSADDTATSKAASGGGTAVGNLQNSSTSSSRRRELNLLQWITSKENQDRLTLMCEECIQGLGTFNSEVYAQLKNEVKHIIKQAEQGDVKEIKGLSDRLCKLEEFKYKVKRMVRDQKELSTAFQQNQNRAINLRDTSILPDLCASHQSQLAVMVSNHQKTREHRRIIAKAKDELGVNLHMRLNRIVQVENSMSEFDNRLLFYHRCLRRAERHIQIIEQIHQAPCIYVAAVTEVVRRKIFSGEFRLWASKLAEDFDIIHSEEIKRRQLFNANFEGHFLNILFPGMNDMPPAFANETPLLFDARLPNITKSDIDMLSSHLPDLAPEIQLPDMGPVINFFVSRSGPHQKERMEELLRQQIAAALNNSTATALCTGEKSLQHPRLGELQKVEIACDESETDTETEFEKLPGTTDAVGETQLPASMITVATSTPIVETVERSAATSILLMQSAETLTDETESSMRAEVERLRDILSSMYKLSAECIRMSRADLEHCRTGTSAYRENLQSDLQMLHDQWSLMRMQYDQRQQQLLQVNAHLNETLQQRDSDLVALRQQICDTETIRSKYVELELELQQLKAQLKAAELEQQRAVEAAREELIYEHKSEIESLRCRYKLMTSMELSPSETSLEKIERPPSNIDQNMIDRSEHETIMAQLRTAFEAEQEKAIAMALETERLIWQKNFSLNSESVMGNVSILKQMLEDKERQLDQLREENIVLIKENYQLKTRIDALTNEDGNSWLKEKIEYLHRDKCRLEEELTMEKERSKRLEMDTSFAALKASTYEQGALALPRSKSSGSSHKYVLLDSCSKGDTVFVVWSVRHGQYMVVQDSQSLYFVHADSLSALNLRLPSTTAAQESTALDNTPIPVPYYAIGRVVDKEFCQAKKDENRYRVSRGSKFYRIKLTPLSGKQQQIARRERVEAFSTSISRSVSQCETSTEHNSAALLPTACKALITSSSYSATSPVQRHEQSSPNLSAAEDSAITTTEEISSKDVIDFATVEARTSPTATVLNAGGTSTGCSSPISVAGHFGNFKERTISFTSVTEEDDDAPPTLLIESSRYIRVNEEDETAIDTPFTTTNTAPLLLQQPVITEQPTASGNTFKLERMLTTSENVTPDLQNEQQPMQTSATTTAGSTVFDDDLLAPATQLTSVPLPQQPHAVHLGTIPTITEPIRETEIIACSARTKNTPFATTGSDDSDEYRSLDPKDDTDFAVTE